MQVRVTNSANFAVIKEGKYIIILNELNKGKKTMQITIIFAFTKRAA